MVESNICGQNFSAGLWSARFTFFLRPPLPHFICSPSDAFVRISVFPFESLGDQLPAFGLWSDDGATNASDPSCKRKPAAELFYAYNYPNLWSPNTGLEETEADLIYFIKDAEGGVSLVNIHDKIGNSDGGLLKMYMDANNLAGRGVNVQFYDDVTARNYSDPSLWFGECANVNRDCHSWDTNNAKGYFSAKWNQDAADGMVNFWRPSSSSPLPRTRCSFL